MNYDLDPNTQPCAKQSWRVVAYTRKSFGTCLGPETLADPSHDLFSA